jgi:hypothetical protein
MKTKDLKEAFYNRTKDFFVRKLSDGRSIEIIEQLNGNLYAILYDVNGIDSLDTMTIAKAAKLLS